MTQGKQVRPRRSTLQHEAPFLAYLGHLEKKTEQKDRLAFVRSALDKAIQFLFCSASLG